jgi:hypothetical protein
LEKEPVMYARFAVIAATLVSTTAFAAEPAKAPAEQSPQPHSAQAPVVLASAADVHAPSTAGQQSPTPPKHHFVRVTSCRCGDQAADPEAQPEE